MVVNSETLITSSVNVAWSIATIIFQNISFLKVFHHFCVHIPCLIDKEPQEPSYLVIKQYENIHACMRISWNIPLVKVKVMWSSWWVFLPSSLRLANFTVSGYHLSHSRPNQISVSWLELMDVNCQIKVVNLLTMTYQKCYSSSVFTCV